MKIIYADTLVLLNAAADLVCLLVTEQVLDRRPPGWRLAVSAALGGGYALCCVLPGLCFLSGAVPILLMACVLTVVAFGIRSFFRSLLCFLGVSAAVGGILFAVWQLTGAEDLFSRPGTGRVFLITFGVSWGILSLAFRRLERKRSGGGVVPVEVTLHGRSVTFTALRDTGNSLRDPISGSRVLVCHIETLLPLFPAELSGAILNIETSAAVLDILKDVNPPVRLRLIPFRTALGDGTLPAFRPDKLILNHKEVSNPLIAMTPETLSDGGAYSALASAEDG